MSDIKIIEKEPYKSFDSWHDTECLLYPTFMIKDNKEYFILNRREPNDDYKSKEDQKIIEKLKQTNGKYTIIYGKFENPFDMLRDIVKNQHSFDGNFINGMFEQDDDFIDFSGNRNELASAFMYRIYDIQMVKEIKEVVEDINNKLYSEANIKLKNCKDEEFSEDFNEENNSTNSEEVEEEEELENEY